MLAFNLAPLFTFGEVLRRLATILRIDGEELARNGLRVFGIWVLAWFAYRVVRLAARRIEVAVDDGASAGGRRSRSCSAASAGWSCSPSRCC